MLHCPECGSVNIRWEGVLGGTEWAECRHCGAVYIVSDEGEYYDHDPEDDENDPAYDETEEWTWVRDARL